MRVIEEMWVHPHVVSRSPGRWKLSRHASTRLQDINQDNHYWSAGALRLSQSSFDQCLDRETQVVESFDRRYRVQKSASHIL